MGKTPFNFTMIFAFAGIIISSYNSCSPDDNKNDSVISAIPAKNYLADSFIKINGANIFYTVKGSNNPAVVFISGFGDDNQIWQQVQDSIAPLALTLSYDRAGLAKSSYSNQPKNAEAIIAELKQLVDSLNIPKPFILVGHSLGANLEKIYAHTYPADIKALVFIDPGYDEEALQKIVSPAMWLQRDAAIKKYTPALNRAQLMEKKELNNIARYSDSIHEAPKVPVTFFTATLTFADFPASGDELKVKQASHANWLKYIPQAKHIIVPTSRHYVQNDNPEIIIAALKELLKK